MNETELAWAAGFFDGEGSVCLHAGTRVRNGREYEYCRARILVAQSGHDGVPLLRRFAAAVGVANERIYGPYIRGSKKVSYQLHIYTQADVKRVMAALDPYLSAPKREQAARTFAAVRAFRAERNYAPTL